MPPVSNLMDSPGNFRTGYFNWINLLLVTAGGILVILFAIGTWMAESAATTSDEIILRFQIGDSLRDIVSGVRDAEAGQRGFLITGNERYLEPYHEGLNRVDEHLSVVRQHLENGRVDRERFRALTDLLDRKKADLQESLDARREGPEEEGYLKARNIVNTDRGKVTTDQILAVVGDELAVHDTEVAALEEKAEGLAYRQEVVLAVGLLSTLFTFIAAGVFNFLERVERHRAEDSLATERTRLEVIVRSSMDAVVAMDDESQILMMNPTAEAMFDLRENDAVGRSFQTLIPERLHSSFSQAVSEVTHSDQHRAIVGHGQTMFGQKTDGREFPLEAVVSQATVNHQSQYTFILKDLTERESGRTQLNEMATILSRIRDAMHVRDLQGRILFWNDGAERIYGWTAEQAIGQRGGELLMATGDEEDAEILARVLNEGVWTGEREIMTRDGSHRIIESRRSLFVDDDNTPVSQLIIDIDVTDEKRRLAAENRSQRLESIGTLASGIAHDLNNVLTPVTMGAQLLQRAATDDRTRSLANAIVSSAERGAGMIRQLLSFAGGTSTPRTSVLVADLLEETYDIISHTFPKTIAVSLQLPDEIWPVTGDPTELSQMLMNLSINARDAMPDGGSLTLEAGNVNVTRESASLGIRQGRYVLISVTDTGTGISRDIQNKIFDPFFTTKEQGKGTGLGLATSMGIARGHHGTMSVFSEPGKGTTFSIYLPAQETVRPDQPEAPSVSSSPEAGGQTVLVIDDEESILWMAREALESGGFRVLTALGGAAGIDAFHKDHTTIAAVIVDMMMPDVDGAATIHTIREKSRKVPIIASSGLKKPETGEHSLEGGDAFLRKPYSAEQLLELLKNVISSGPSAVPSSKTNT
ncbi:MAG: PAS domain S-box protein [Planctomycetaceae bacterium]